MNSNNKYEDFADAKQILVGKLRQGMSDVQK